MRFSSGVELGDDSDDVVVAADRMGSHNSRTIRSSWKTGWQEVLRLL